jgi:hypothetical protein
MTTKETKASRAKPRTSRNKPSPDSFDGLPVLMDAAAIVRATHGLYCLETAAVMLRSQEIPSFVLRHRRVTRREDFLAALAKLANSAA